MGEDDGSSTMPRAALSLWLAEVLALYDDVGEGAEVEGTLPLWLAEALALCDDVGEGVGKSEASMLGDSDWEGAGEGVLEGVATNARE